ncbi:polysaccharide deacetylase family protein [Virgibacillus sp. NKC19-16]|uniref:polysaccharide deacetylase family protein n=1 Tax=Virgibacillus salidurans TaxID=2831673 RepID=UPI001F22CD18|nr:polysaccharide deacetylase family protein [Virgibacillus sp. NKC19-16]UJL47974.1 polysaccharide deacetylase family protein [Virgibacillus sp. NKC19-16]
MYRYKRAVNFCIFILIVVLAFNPDNNPFFIAEVSTFEVVKTEDALYQEIQEKGSDYSLPPQNAYIDSVWNKTPGRNGVEVNIDASYEKMKKEGTFDESLLVYEQTPPEITLEDLAVSPIYRGHPEKDMVAFLVNVSWGTEHIPDILNILKDNNVKATFFLEGQWAQENAEFVEMIDEQGHTVGNHAYNHPNMARLSPQENTRQISQTNEIIKAITGDTPKWFAPPSGDYTDQVVQAAHDLQMETILWTVDTIDWKNPSVSVMINRVNSKLHPGATILMHPTESITEGLDPLIRNIKENGYRIGTLDKLLSEER